MSTSPLRSRKKLHTPKRQPLPPLPMLHSTPLAVPRKLSSDPASTGLSSNRSRSSLPPLDLGEGDARPISSMSAPIQAGTSSVVGPIALPSMSVSALNLTADHTKIIFNLACEGQHLKEWVVRSLLGFPAKKSCFTPRPNLPVTSC